MTAVRRDPSAPPDDDATPHRRSDDPLDLRLAIGALAAWLALIAALPRSPGVVLPSAVLCGLLGVGALVVRRWRAAPVLALALFAVALVLFPLGLRSRQAAAGPLQTLARRGASVELQVSVTADPRPLAATGVSGSPRVVVETDALSVRLGGRDLAVGSAVLVLADATGWRDVLPGQRVRVSGTLQPDLGGSVLSVTLFERGPPHLLGRPPWWQRAAGAVRTSLRSAARVLPAQECGLLPGLIDGDTSNLDPVLADRFRLAGLTHLVAVSGASARPQQFWVGRRTRKLRGRCRGRPPRYVSIVRSNHETAGVWPSLAHRKRN